MASGIYQIENQENGKCYIGSSVHLEKRWQEHLWALRGRRHENCHLQRAFGKYGEAAFCFSVLEKTGLQQLLQREQHYLDTLAPEYNIALTASHSMLGRHHTAETRRKISEANKGRKPSKETRRKLREAGFRRKHTAATRHKLAQSWTLARREQHSQAIGGANHHNYGKQLSPETRQRITTALTGRVLSQETRSKMSAAWTPLRRRRKSERQRETLGGEGNPMYGKHHSAEARRKIGAAHKGKVISLETRSKLSRSLRAYHERRRVSLRGAE